MNIEKKNYNVKSYEEIDDSEDLEKQVDSSTVQNILNNRTISKSGNVVGIDISNWTSPEKLRTLLTTNNIIDNSTKVSTYANSEKYISINTENISGKINYVYIKIGASGYSKQKDFRIFESEIYKEQAKVCEELGILYGFYYYSTSINKEEARKEGEYIINSINKLDKNKFKYNILPVALDVELTSNQDRQYGIEVSETKAIVSNIVSEKYGPTILYGGKKILDSNDKILDYDKYTSQLKNGSLGIWFVSPRGVDGSYNNENVKYNEKIKSDIILHQDLLDVNLNGIGVDIDIIQADIFDSLIQGEYLQIESYNKYKNVKISDISRFSKESFSDKMLDEDR